MTAMQRNNLCVLLASACFLAGACGGEDARPPSWSAVGGSGVGGSGVGGSASGGRTPFEPDGTSGASEGGRDSEAGDAGAAGEAGSGTPGAAGQGPSMGGAGGETTDPSGAGAPVVLATPTCRTDLELDVAILVPMPTTGQASFVAMTPDELVLAWEVTSDNVTTLHVASRASESAPFGQPVSQTIDTPDPISLSADGLRIVLVDADRRGFSLLQREALDAPFVSAESAIFSFLSEPEALLPGESLGSPVLAPHELSFYYSRFGANTEANLYVSHRISPYAFFAPGTPLPVSDELLASGEDRWEPTAATGDQLTLFAWNPAQLRSVVVSLDQRSGVFGITGQLGARPSLMPNGDCSRVYHSSVGDAGIFVSDVL